MDMVHVDINFHDLPCFDKFFRSSKVSRVHSLVRREARTEEIFNLYFPIDMFGWVNLYNDLQISIKVHGTHIES